MPHFPIFDGITPGLMLLELSLGLVTLCVLNILVSLVEGVTLTLLKWNNFSRSILISFLMNTLSSLVGGVLLVVFQENPIIWLVLVFILSVLIELGVMWKVQPDTGIKNGYMCLAANLSSYVILILPAYLFSLAD